MTVSTTVRNNSSDSHDIRDALIVGGGMVGLTLGCALARGGMSVTLLDRAPPAADPPQGAAGYDGRASAISLGSARVFRGVGLWDALQPHAEPILDIRVADGHPLRGVSNLFVHYDHRQVAAQTGGAPFGYIIENRVILRGLRALASSLPNLRILAPAVAAGFATSGEYITLHTEREAPLRARLLLAADGAGSPLRRAAGIRTVDGDYRQTAIVCTVAHQRPHNGVAVELFQPSGPFAMLPMTGRRSNVIWSERSDLAARFLKLDDETFRAELRSRFGDWLGEIKPVGPRFAYPLRIALAERYIAPRFALLGDAAHVIHPIAGQGYNMGVRDVAALAQEALAAFRLGLDPGAPQVLAAYQRRRRFDNSLLAGVCHGLLKLFSNDDPLLRAARGVGLALVNAAPPLKTPLMLHAMGVLGDLPDLLREPRR